MCSCLKQKLLNISYNKSNMTNLGKENFENFNPNIFSDEISTNFNISPKQNILNIKQKCIEFVNDFDNPNSKNLLFTGNTGLGKTYMSNCIANELIKKGKNVLYQTAPVLLETIIDNKFNKYKTANKDNFYKEQLNETLFLKNAKENNQIVNYNQVEGYDHSYFFIATFLEEHFEFHMRYLK